MVFLIQRAPKAGQEPPPGAFRGRCIRQAGGMASVERPKGTVKEDHRRRVGSDVHVE